MTDFILLLIFLVLIYWTVGATLVVLWLRKVILDFVNTTPEED